VNNLASLSEVFLDCARGDFVVIAAQSFALDCLFYEVQISVCSVWWMPG